MTWQAGHNAHTAHGLTGVSALNARQCPPMPGHAICAEHGEALWVHTPVAPLHAALHCRALCTVGHA